MTDEPIRHLTGGRVALDDGRLARSTSRSSATIHRVAAAGAVAWQA